MSLNENGTIETKDDTSCGGTRAGTIAFPTVRRGGTRQPPRMYAGAAAAFEVEFPVGMRDGADAEHSAAR